MEGIFKKIPYTIDEMKKKNELRRNFLKEDFEKAPQEQFLLDPY